MGKYIVNYTETAISDLQKHKKYGNKAVLNKILAIVNELEEHPYTGIGKPEQLKHTLVGFWSRRINQKYRLIYTVEEEIVTVEIVSVIGHYGDK
ncbi:toxin YoeB [Flavobacterium arsenatis]|uniref:Putative mRNA interferase YoeB n=1 Tax=Flavobacterium arsenatis TaxID=1484332 RepID=A0ABU1TQ91_9FLAO|nr:Txe/YoeB family addiction module toxin [Flavobacterium arsenatis]MDR6968134.1 toxin YoeB [Flavobacterium arsenatis]